MKNITLIGLFLMSIGCSLNKNEAVVETHKSDLGNFNYVNTRNFQDNPYEIDFDVNQINKEERALVIKMNLAEGSYYLSPHTNPKYEFSGVFKITLESNSNIIMYDSLVETPRSYEYRDSVYGGPANFVKENTTYEQKFKVLNDNDFDVKGLVQFTIEPKCTYEEIVFVLSNKSGKMTVTHSKK